jgi:hypothetical protein
LRRSYRFLGERDPCLLDAVEESVTRLAIAQVANGKQRPGVVAFLVPILALGWALWMVAVLPSSTAEMTVMIHAWLLR